MELTAMHAPISYKVTPADPSAHLFNVELQVAQAAEGGQEFTLPAWIPGSYMIRDFARNIVTIRASVMGRELLLEKIDKQSWRLPPHDGPVTLHYQVYAWDLSVRAAHLDQTHGYFNGTSLYLRVVGQEDVEHQVELRPPDGDAYRAWKVATTLPAADVDARGFGLYQVSDYDSLVDYPVEMGSQTLIDFEAAGVPHQLTLTGRHACDVERVAEDLAAVCSHHAAMFGELPVERYLFMTLVTADGYGGLEHRDSTSLMCAREDLPRAGLKEPDEGYKRFLGLCSHEYFHLWNVKRIRPEVLKRSDLSREAHTRLLWAFEGFTAYYDDLGLVRSGCIGEKAYLELFAQTLSRVMRGTGRAKQSVADSSFDAWTKFYKQDENAPNAIVSYYTKGSLVAFGLDMTLRDRTAGGVTLDDLLRALWERHGKPDLGVPEDGIERIATELCDSDLSDFFRRYVYGTDELPLADWFASLGVGFALVPAEDAKDQGKCLDSAPEAGEPNRVLGARWTNEQGVALLTHVFEGGAAQLAGLSAGDRLIAMDGLQVLPDKLEKRIAEGGAKVTMHAFRRDELMTFEVCPQPAPADTARLWLLPDAELSDSQRARRLAWFAGSCR